MEGAQGEYYLGLDIGTDSVGWAVTDDKYNILKINRKSTWGIHLFDSGTAAEERRMHRCSRRRLERRKQRVRLLRELFTEEIFKVDPSFFERLDESNLYEEDKKTKQSNSLFNDENFTDLNYHRKYPTIYHLRKDLMTTESKPDIRLVYLAVHHIIKYRGHFLFEGILDGDLPQFEGVFAELLNKINDECDFQFNADNIMAEIKEILLNVDTGMSEKVKKLNLSLSADDPAEKEFVKLIVGGKIHTSKLFNDDSEINFSLKDSDFDDKIEEYEDSLGSDKTIIIRLAKQVFDWSILTNLLKGKNRISEAKIEEYDRHKEDLRLLKNTVRRFYPEKYHEIFKDKNKNDNYSAYVKKGKDKSCTQEVFCKYLRGIFKDFDWVANDLKDMEFRLNNDSFLPKQTSKENSVIPYTLHYQELNDILENVSRFYPFFSIKDESDISVKEKIKMLDKFRIPYYVGPLNKSSDKSWVVRKAGKITPWNFENMVDLDESSQLFIERQTNCCKHLVGEKVLPKNSIIYSRFRLYDELNNIKINGERLHHDLKMTLVRDLFENKVNKVTKKRLKEYFKTQGLMSESDEITGVDDSIKSVLKSEIQIRGIIGDRIKKRDMVEDIIRLITIFGDDSDRIRKKIGAKYSKSLTDEEIFRLSKLRFNDWSGLSEKFLTGISHIDRSTGVAANIMTGLENTENDLQELLSDRYTYSKQIEEMNQESTSDFNGKITYDLVKDLFVSPSVKRGIWRTLRVVQDVTKAMGRPPSKAFIETTRENRNTGRTISRKKKLSELYRACGEEEWASEIEGLDDAKLRGKALYSYYVQQGRCMYCGKKLNVTELGNNTFCDIDHIYPQSRVKDDSIHNNMVLVCKGCNMEKSDTYPLSAKCRNSMRPHWDYLRKNNIITEEKYARLIRSTELTDKELSGFISRQLVETSQSVNKVATLLRMIFGKVTELVYVKGGLVSEFRHGYNFIKCRNVNDYHHAKDAYLNIVVGNIYNTKFTNNYLQFVKSHEKYHMDIVKICRENICRNGIDAWRGGEDGTVMTVKKYMKRNDILFTRFSSEERGILFHQKLLKKKETLFRPKEGMDPKKYGGYDNIKGSFFVLVEHDLKGKKVRTIEAVPIYVVNTAHNSDFSEYFIKDLGLINHKIICKIKMKSMIEIDGFRTHISGRTGKEITYTCGVQLILSERMYDYSKKIFNFVEGNKNLTAVNSNLTGEENILLFDEFLSKMKSKPYSIIFSKQAITLQEKRGDFINKSIDVQGKVLNEIMHIFQCNPSFMDLKDLAGPTTGRIRFNKKIDETKTFKMICQSPSGLFEKEVNLNKI